MALTIAEFGDSIEEEIAKSVWENIGLNAIFQPVTFYIDLMNELGLKLIDKRKIKYPKKMTIKQAKEEIAFACENAPKIFKSFGVQSVAFDETWSRFGSLIEAHGMAYWSTFWVLVFQKSV